MASLHSTHTIPNSEIGLAKSTKTKNWRESDKERICPDEDKGEEGGHGGGQGELPVLGHHHVPLHR